jgi:hypothetical protein
MRCILGESLQRMRCECSFLEADLDPRRIAAGSRIAGNGWAPDRILLLAAIALDRRRHVDLQNSSAADERMVGEQLRRGV